MRTAFAAFLLLSLASSAAFAAVADDAARVMDNADQKLQTDRQQRVQRSLNATERRAPTDLSNFKLLAEIKDISHISLAETLKLATTYNRDFASERDQNISTGLSYLQARHLFDPRLSGSVSVLQGWANNTAADRRASALTASGDMALDFATDIGTKIRVGLNTSTSHDFNASSKHDQNSSGARIDLSQPLLRGAGRTVAREPLTQAERAVLDRLRDFELFRQDFTINAISQFYDLVRQKQVVTNYEENLKLADFEHRRAKGLFKISKANELDVLQAEQQRLTAENNLRDAKESYKDSLLVFKTFLGLPDDLVMDIRTDELPAFKKVDLDPDQSVKIAFENRLDLAKAVDQVDDAKRGLRIANNALLPDLNFKASAGSGSSASQFGRQAFEDHSASAGLTLNLPLDRLNERAAAKNAELSVERAERGLSQLRDSLASDVRRRLRKLISIEQSMEVQKRILIASEKALARAGALFRQGKKASRDVSEAQQALLQARNTDVQYIVDHTIAELQLRRALGTLSVLPDGRPADPPAPAAAAPGSPTEVPASSFGATE